MQTDKIRPVLLDLTGVDKSFGQVHALSGVSLSLHQGLCTGLVGHNGAGKSTLINVIAGFLPPSAGDVAFDGVGTLNLLSIDQRSALGIRCVLQELSLCPNLTVAENTQLLHRHLRGRGWRRKAADLIIAKLDDIFPGHGIAPHTELRRLPLGARQMVEIARAFTQTTTEVRLVILDEPTSSLDTQSSAQLLRYVRTFVEGGKNCLFVSHKMDEITSVTDEVVVLKDGRVVHQIETKDTSRAEIVSKMGSIDTDLRGASQKKTFGGKDSDGIALGLPAGPDIPPLSLRPGEVIGLAGLAGDGQTEALKSVLARYKRKCTFVAGDRATDGVFPLWSIKHNTSIGALHSLLSNGIIRSQSEAKLANDWKDKIGIRASGIDADLTSLSGGNQQKVLFARALASASDIVLMDDPTRGVDVGTKREIYQIIEAEAQTGRSFLWYSTEFDELTYCDRVLVFCQGKVAVVLEGAEINEQNVIAFSFGQKVSA